MARKPARKAQKPKRPAAQQKTKQPNVSLADVAAKLGVSDQKSLRARIRRIRGGAQVGKGGRYGWNSFSDPDLKSLLKELS
jgi:hypothetical protein